MIKLATLNDLPLLTPLFMSYLDFYSKPSSADRCETFLGERIKNGESVIFIAINDQVQAVGFAQMYPSFSSLSQKRSWILNDLFVAPAARKTGVGKALLMQCEQYSKESGAIGLSLQTSSDNFTAQALYESMGWQRDSQFVTYFLKH